ncbi:MAG: phosphopantothenoylcysteine decarboxylase [Verrucomicrobia bacterium]|nr:phosphopantothenoylcysteine decarboxylase [Verrucomicrobiota bacterium]
MDRGRQTGGDRRAGTGALTAGRPPGTRATQGLGAPQQREHGAGVSSVPTIVLGVTGSIAAHRAVDLCSLLVQARLNVRVVMTADAQRFVTSVPFQTLSRNPVLTDLYAEDGWKPAHIQLADDASVLVIAPATAHCMARVALGLADDALTSLALAVNPEARLLMAPAMNGRMWQHPATQGHAATLRQRGWEFLGPEEGLLACGYAGLGRLWPVEAIASRIQVLAARG